MRGKAIARTLEPIGAMMQIGESKITKTDQATGLAPSWYTSINARLFITQTLLEALLLRP